MNDKNQSKDQKINLEDNFEIEELLNLIEDRQIEQVEMLNFKDEENHNLKKENQRLNSLLSSIQDENQYLKSELNKTRKLIIDNEQKYKSDLDKKMSEVYTIMEISKKIEEQNKEIYELEQETKKQREKFAELESSE